MQYVIGSIIEGKVSSITKFGAFIDLDDGGVGLVHISEVSQTYVNDISEHLAKEQRVKVKILNIDENGKISLSIRKALPQETRPVKKFNKPEQNSGEKPFQKKRMPPQRSGNFAVHQQTQSNSFEDMLSKFIQTSDEKISNMKREKNVRRGGGQQKRNKDYDY